jgi:hypothetical protein
LAGAGAALALGMGTGRVFSGSAADSARGWADVLWWSEFRGASPDVGAPLETGGWASFSGPEVAGMSSPAACTGCATG